MIDFIVQIDTAVTLFFNEHLTNSFVLWFFNIFSIVGTGALCWIAVFLALSVYRKSIKTWLYWAMPFLALYLISELGIKHLVCRPRPFVALEGIHMLAARLKSFSFPSGHSALSASALLAAWKIKAPPSLVPYLAVSVLISVSRVVLKAHYLSDVIAGYAIGLLITFAVIKLLDCRKFTWNDQV